MSNKELKNLAKQQMQGNVWMLFFIGFLASLINSAVGAIPVVGWVAVFFTSGIVGISICKIYLNLVDGRKPAIEDIQLGMNQWKEGAMLSLLISVFIALWLLLLIIPGIIKALAYSQSFYILADNPGMSGEQALKESIKMMDGHKWDLFVLSLSFIGWHLLALCTCGILYIYLTPYLNATYTNFYNSIKGGNAYAAA